MRLTQSMTAVTSRRRRLVWLAVGGLFLATSSSAFATIDTFTIDHHSGACGNLPFDSKHMLWPGRDRIAIASGERITVTLYGHGADFAQDATGPRIHEWVSDTGTTTDYPGAPIYIGARWAKGYVKVSIRAQLVDGLGQRNVTVKWLTGTETIRLRIVNCSDLSTTSTYRRVVLGNGTGFPGNSPGSNGGSNTAVIPDLLPERTPSTLARRSSAAVATTEGGMFEVPGYFCGGLVPDVPSTVAVPKLTWGVSGIHIEAASTPFVVQLIDIENPDMPRLLDTLTLAQGFPANTPLVQKDNYPGRATSLRVILNPEFPNADGTQTFPGCFTAPGSTEPRDPKRMLVKVDPDNRIDEGSGENNNELPF